MNPYSNQYLRDVDPNSTMTKVEHHYWITKQSVFKKIGKKDDECVVASDAELDAKLELFKSIQDSCSDLQKIIDRYQERICCLAQEENSMGRFLKESGKSDKTRAGKMMTTVGKSLCYSGQQRLQLRSPLLRLYQEVETFRQRAISDTLFNLKSMEKRRIEYRAALSWMKDVSHELDPEKQLDKFRKVQSQVRRSKTRFDQVKLVCLQKVDLLAAARCNMFSHALVMYHNTLLQFTEKTCNTFQTIASCFKGYQHYDFCVVKELTEPSLKLFEQMNGGGDESKEEGKQEDKDILLFFDPEYHDDDIKPELDKKEENQTTTDTDILLDLDSLATNTASTSSNTDLDLSTNELELKKTLDEIFSDTSNVHNSFEQEWDAVFGCKNEESPVKNNLFTDFFDQQTATSSAAAADVGTTSSDLSSLLMDQMQFNVDNTSFDLNSCLKLSNMENSKPSINVNKKVTSDKKPTTTNTQSKDMSSWFNLFADLDPLTDPDSLGVVKSVNDRNC